MPAPELERLIARLEGHLARLQSMREHLSPESIAGMRGTFERQIADLRRENRRRNRRGDGSMPALVEPPRGPQPLQGGAAAPLEFD